MTQLLDHRRPVADLGGQPTAPLTAPARRFYLVGEAERSTPRPAPASADRTSIQINGAWHELKGRTATFEQLLRIAFPQQPLQSPGAATVTYRQRFAAGFGGTLCPGDVIELADGLVINATATAAS